MVVARVCPITFRLHSTCKWSVVVLVSGVVISIIVFPHHVHVICMILMNICYEKFRPKENLCHMKWSPKELIPGKNCPK